MARTTVGATEAAKILGRSVQIVRYWGASGKLRPVRRHPMRFSRREMEAARTLFPVSPTERRGRSRLPTAAKLARGLIQEGATR